MKAKIKKTGEVVEVVRNKYGDYIDANFYCWEQNEVVLIEEDPHWQDVRERAAIAAMQAIICAPIIDGVDPNPSKEHISELAVQQADALVEQLKTIKL